jgi:hypothetical protein
LPTAAISHARARVPHPVVDQDLRHLAALQPARVNDFETGAHEI